MLKKIEFKTQVVRGEKKRQISLWGRLDQIKYFVGANHAQILFKGVSGQSELFEVVKMSFFFLSKYKLDATKIPDICSCQNNKLWQQGET